MKRFFYYIASIALIASCSGTIDPELGEENTPVIIPSEFTEPFTLYADKTEVEASGEDFVTFSLKDAYDREMLTDMNALQSINIISEEGVRVPRMKTSASFIANGTYNFTATFKGKKSANKVQVQARNRAKYEVYHRNVGLFKCTSVWCIACPSLGKSLNNLSESTKDHTVTIAFHGNYDAADPFSLYVGNTDLGSYVMGYFRGSGWPTLVYDLNEVAVGGTNTSDIEASVMERRVQSPATCGIKVSSVKLEGTALTINASLKSATGGEYDMACAVLRDGLVYQGGYSVNNDGVYNEVAVALSESFLGYYQGEKVEAGEEINEVFSFDFGENVPSASDLEGYYVAVYAHRKTSEGSTMDNIVTCKYGKSVDYRLND